MLRPCLSWEVLTWGGVLQERNARKSGKCEARDWLALLFAWTLNTLFSFSTSWSNLQESPATHHAKGSAQAVYASSIWLAQRFSARVRIVVQGFHISVQSPVIRAPIESNRIELLVNSIRPFRIELLISSIRANYSKIRANIRFERTLVTFVIKITWRYKNVTITSDYW